MRTLFDSTNPADIPQSAEMVGYYVDGIYAVSEASVRARCRKAVLVPISAVGTNAGIVGDVEPGCMSPEQAVNWVRIRRAAGVDPSIYVNQNQWPRVRQLMQAAGITEPHYWIADWRNYPDTTIPPDAVARQYGGSAQTRQHYDISSVVDNWPGIDKYYSGGSGSLTGEDMTPEEHSWLESQTWRQFWFLGGDPALGPQQYKVANAPTLKELRDALVSHNEGDPTFPTMFTSPLDKKLATLQTALDGGFSLLGTRETGFIIPMLQAIEDEIAKIPTAAGPGGTVDLAPVLAKIAEVRAKFA